MAPLQGYGARRLGGLQNSLQAFSDEVSCMPWVGGYYLEAGLDSDFPFSTPGAFAFYDALLYGVREGVGSNQNSISSFNSSGEIVVTFSPANHFDDSFLTCIHVAVDESGVYIVSAAAAHGGTDAYVLLSKWTHGGSFVSSVQCDAGDFDPPLYGETPQDVLIYDGTIYLLYRSSSFISKVTTSLTHDATISFSPTTTNERFDIAGDEIYTHYSSTLPPVSVTKVYNMSGELQRSWSVTTEPEGENVYSVIGDILVRPPFVYYAASNALRYTTDGDWDCRNMGTSLFSNRTLVYDDINEKILAVKPSSTVFTFSEVGIYSE